MLISIEEAVTRLSRGEIIAVQTETVYGLAALMDNEEAVRKLFSLKGRPSNNPLIMHVSNTDTAKAYITKTPPFFKELTNTFWPGPLTLVLPARIDKIPPLPRAGLSTIGIRVPSNPLCLELLQKTGPLVMPSANLSGRPSSTSPAHVEEDFGQDFPILGSGACEKGLESTVLFYGQEGWEILRPGAVSPLDLFPILSESPYRLTKSYLHPSSAPLCPGRLYRHYSPKAQVFVGSLEQALQAGVDFILGFKDKTYPSEKKVIYLGKSDCPEEVAGNLYHALRQLDIYGARAAWVDMTFPRTGLWETIAERLTRAAEI